MSNLVYQTKCLLCGWSFTEAGLSETDIDLANPSPQVRQLRGKLLEHIQKGAQAEQKSLEKAQDWFKKKGGAIPDAAKCLHLQVAQDIAARFVLGDASGILQAFDSKDPMLRMLKETVRLQLNTRTRKIYFTDEMILDAVVQIGLNPDQQAQVMNFCTQMRDALMEQGRFAPGQEGVTQMEAAARLVI